MDFRRDLAKVYWRIQKVIVPTLRYSQDIYEDILNHRVSSASTWLDLGCGHSTLPPWRENEEKRLLSSCRLVVGLDQDLTSLKKHRHIKLKVNGSIDELPFRKESFDLATANMVVEHLPRPEALFREVNRILRPGGIFIFHTPNIFGYTTVLAKLVPNWLRCKLVYLLEGRKSEDVYKTYYRANARGKILDLAKAAGFEEVKIRMIVSSAAFAILPPLVVLELVWIRILMWKQFQDLRTNIIAVLRKH